MNYQDKSKEELIIELQKLQHENKDNTERKQVE